MFTRLSYQIWRGVESMHYGHAAVFSRQAAFA